MPPLAATDRAEIESTFGLLIDGCLRLQKHALLVWGMWVAYVAVLLSMICSGVLFFDDFP